MQFLVKCMLCECRKMVVSSAQYALKSPALTRWLFSPGELSGREILGPAPSHEPAREPSRQKFLFSKSFENEWSEPCYNSCDSDLILFIKLFTVRCFSLTRGMRGVQKWDLRNILRPVRMCRLTLHGQSGNVVSISCKGQMKAFKMWIYVLNLTNQVSNAYFLFLYFSLFKKICFI